MTFPRFGAGSLAAAAAILLTAASATIASQDPGRPDGPAPADRAGAAEGPACTAAARSGHATSIPELAARLDLARKQVARAEALRRNGTVPQEELDEAEGRARILEGRLEGLAQGLHEEVERLEARLAAKQAGLKRATALLGLASRELEAQAEALERVRAGLASPAGREKARAEAEVLRAEADREVRAAEVREVEVRLRHARRRLEALAPLRKDAEEGGDGAARPAVADPPLPVKLRRTR